MKITILTDTSAGQELSTLAEIMTRLRYHTKYWQDYYGAINRNKMHYWEVKADEWIVTNLEQED